MLKYNRVHYLHFCLFTRGLTNSLNGFNAIAAIWEYHSKTMKTDIDGLRNKSKNDCIRRHRPTS